MISFLVSLVALIVGYLLYDVGTIAYFSPWNNVCLYYGDMSRYPGLYVMGKAVSGTEQIRNIKGKVKIEAVGQ